MAKFPFQLRNSELTMDILHDWPSIAYIWTPYPLQILLNLATNSIDELNLGS